VPDAKELAVDAPAPIGRDLRRPDGPAKVRGEAVYVADLDVTDAWLGTAVRADLPRGRLLGFDRDPAFDFARVVLAFAGDIPGENVQALIVDDQPILCDTEVRHFGEVLALIAAPDRVTLEAARRALTARIEPLPPVLDFEASTVWQKELRIEKGDLADGFARADLIVEGEYRTDSQEQLYIETQGMVAWPPDASGVVTVAGSLQCPHYVQKALRRMLDLPPERCRVVQCATGGGFGGKEEYPSVLACHAALLALRAGRPVRMIYDRHEDLSVTPKRHPSRVRHRTGLTRDGRLVAMEIDVLLDGGAYTTLSPVVLSRGMLHATGPYRCPNVRIDGRVAATNHVPYGAFRGFGAPQTCFAIERQMDRIARRLGIHPFELRRRNALREGDRTATGQSMDASCASAEVLEGIADRTGIHRAPWGQPKPATGRKRCGRGMSFFFHGAGFTGSGEEMLKGRVRVALLDDGRVEVFAGSTEIGQGTATMFTAIAAAALGADPGDVVIAAPDTAAVPDSGPTVASRTCMIVGGCLERACAELARRVGGDANLPFRTRARAFLEHGGASGGERAVEVVYGSPPGLVWDDRTYRGDAYPTYGWAADVAEVEVDLDTFEVEVVDFHTVVDVGKAIQPLLVRGQIEGGSLQAVGFAHREVVTTKNGRFQQDRLATCIVPTSLDAPPMHVGLVEKPFRHGPFGAKGVGELPMDGGAPAVAAAIEDALGVSPDRLPMTPERLLAAWLDAHPEELAP
jgi:CO/xanthine dehydrogenase Mo-binding subunit